VSAFHGAIVIISTSKILNKFEGFAICNPLKGNWPLKQSLGQAQKNTVFVRSGA
jgi:hypothetical protein